MTDGDARTNLKDLGAPAIIDIRGSDVEVLFIDRHDNYMRDCMYAADRWDLIDPNPLSSFPAVHNPNGIDNDDGVDLATDCGHRPGGPDEAFGEEFGRVGSNVTAVTFKFAHAAPVQGTVWHGFYEAWWNWPGYPDGLIWRTLSGEIFKAKIVDTYFPATESC